MPDYVCKLFRGLPLAALLACLPVCAPDSAGAADKLIGLHSAQVMSQSMPWIAQRAKSVKPQDLIDRRYLIELEKSGAFGK